jgi:hypothetical protein
MVAVMDWQMMAAIAAVCAVGGAFFDRIFGRRDNAIKDISKQLHAHELTDAAAFAELRSALASMSRDQIGVETRIMTGIEGIRMDVRGVNDRVDKILEGRN